MVSMNKGKIIIEENEENYMGFGYRITIEVEKK